MIRPYSQMIGLARYTVSLRQALDEAGVGYTLVEPGYPWPIRAAHRLLAGWGFDVRTFFTTYPVSASEHQPGALTHMTAQQMATLLWFKPRVGPVVITVHDIVPFLVRADARQTTFRHPLDRLFDRLAMSGLHRAEFLIADSEFTRQTLISALKCDAHRIKVVPLGVRHEIFRPVGLTPDFYHRFNLTPGLRYVLYVGSENPRKNLPRLLQAFQRLYQEFPDSRLIKIGTPEYTPQARALQKQIMELGLQDAVLFVNHVTDDDLARFYNLAWLFVFPSLLEGFGLPPLEAMACGAPVVCSSAASLPEVVGDAALLVDPTDVDALADAMCRVLRDARLREELRARGLVRAAQFTWQRTAQQTLEVYREVSG